MRPSSRSARRDPPRTAVGAPSAPPPIARWGALRSWSILNLSVFLLRIVREAVDRAKQTGFYAQLGALEAVVFAWAAIEALLNEQAYIAINVFGHGDEIVYHALERSRPAFDRVQATLRYLYGSALDDSRQPADHLKHLIRLRNGLVHYKFRDPDVVKTLNQLVQLGYLNEPSTPWDQLPIAWTGQVKPELAVWAYHTACDTAVAIADLMPDDEHHREEAKIIRANFERELV
ncbi:MAG TPA: hypothetical protein VN674_13860 [Gemmatimonadales bacterium]|nr:hypothetical protein [Gemmatimonadales bacterium]